MELKELLDQLATKYNVPSFIETDPIQFPRKYTLLQDIEISALLTSVITWGKRALICRSAERLHLLMGESPYRYIMSKEWGRLKESNKNIHRTFFERDLFYFCQGLHDYYQQNDSLEKLFVDHGILGGIDQLSQLFSSRHLASPVSKSPCKRTNLMLKWLVRDDGIVDMGVWTRLSPAQLIIPLDVHVARVSRTIWDDLPKTERLATACKITEYLSQLCPEDPCKYDFALFGFGEEEQKELRK